MRAVGIMVHGGPEALEVVDLLEVHAGPGQVRVRISAAAVNPTDTMARNGSRAEQQKRSEEHTSELQSPCNLVCRLLLEKKKKLIRVSLGTVRHKSGIAGRQE